MELDPGILAGIIAKPDDDFLRAVAADWWEENGDPDRASFVRTQLALHEMRALAPSYEVWRRECPVLRSVSSTKAKKQDMGVGFIEDFGQCRISTVTPPTITCDVGDQELLFMENLLSNGRHVGRLVGLAGRLVETVSGDQRWRFTVQEVRGITRDMKNRCTSVTLVPEPIDVIVAGTADPMPRRYYHTLTDDVRRYFSLKEQERELLSVENARRWCEGPWFQEWYSVEVNKELVVQVITHRALSNRTHTRDTSCRFQFDRGFIAAAQFQRHNLPFPVELMKRHPIKEADIKVMGGGYPNSDT